MLSGCRTGEAKLTRAYRLPSRCVIHTVGPVWRGGTDGEPEALAACYRNALELAARHHLQSIAFPCISTGIFGYPKGRAASIAVSSAKAFLDADTSVGDVIFCCFSEDDLQTYRTLGIAET